jgi:SagB-type dehydrogenase family enzyme
MEPDFSFLYHQSSKDLAKGHPPIPLDAEDWPIEWRTVYYKAYDRLPKIDLPIPKRESDLFETILQRKSRKIMSSQPISLEEVACLLKYSCGNLNLVQSGRIMHRAQPSGGERYPIEVYPLVLTGDNDLKPGLYHYNVKLHALDVLWEKKFSAAELDTYFTFDWVKRSSCVFIMTAVFHRNQIKYGERGYRYILIESGHIGQNMCLVSEAIKLKCRPLGGTRDLEIESLLEIDGIGESVVYAMAVGR